MSAKIACPYCSELTVTPETLESCEECCGHDYEEFMCLNCGKEQDIGALIDAAEYRFDPER